jgi:hypothetical protein
VTRLGRGTEVTVQTTHGGTLRGLVIEANPHELRLLTLDGTRIPPELAKGLIDAYRRPSVEYTFRGTPINVSALVRVIPRAAVRRIDRDASRAATMVLGAALGAGVGLVAGFHLGPAIAGPCDDCEMGDYGPAMGGAALGMAGGGLLGGHLASKALRSGRIYEASPHDPDQARGQDYLLHPSR